MNMYQQFSGYKKWAFTSFCGHYWVIINLRRGTRSKGVDGIPTMNILNSGKVSQS